MTNNPITIAIDGPAGAGKSSIAKDIARIFSYVHLDTGAMYRAITWAAIKRQLIGNVEAVVSMLPELELTVKYSDSGNLIFLNGENITTQIRTAQVNQHVSEIASIKEVRLFLVDLQRKLAATGGMILDGRDIGSVVLPNADIKIYLTASVEARARRRWKQERRTGEKASSLKSIKKSIMKRDAMDMSREESPLLCPKDAIIIDNSNLTYKQTVEKISRLLEATINDE